MGQVFLQVVKETQYGTGACFSELKSYNPDSVLLVHPNVCSLDDVESNPLHKLTQKVPNDDNQNCQQNYYIISTHTQTHRTVYQNQRHAKEADSYVTSLHHLGLDSA